MRVVRSADVFLPPDPVPFPEGLFLSPHGQMRRFRRLFPGVSLAMNALVGIPRSTQDPLLVVPPWSLLGETYEAAIHRLVEASEGLFYIDPSVPLLELDNVPRRDEVHVVPVSLARVDCSPSWALRFAVGGGDGSRCGLSLYELLLMILFMRHHRRMRAMHDFRFAAVGSGVLCNGKLFFPLAQFQNSLPGMGACGMLSQPRIEITLSLDSSSWFRVVSPIMG